jgi:hypothetical protein
MWTLLLIVSAGLWISYLHSAALDLPVSGYCLEHMLAGFPSNAYRDPDFLPCAVICKGCPDGQTIYNDLPLDK